MVRKFWDEITLPGYNKIVAEMLPGKNAKAMQDASKFFRDKGVQSRPTQCHGIDIVTDNPHITSDHIGGLDSDMVLKPGMIIMAEPKPDHRRRHVRYLPRPHLHYHRHRPRDRGRLSAGDRGCRLNFGGRSANR